MPSRSQRHLREIYGVDSGGNRNELYNHTNTLASLDGYSTAGAGWVDSNVNPGMRTSSWNAAVNPNQTGGISFDTGLPSGTITTSALLTLVLQSTTDIAGEQVLLYTVAGSGAVPWSATNPTLRASKTSESLFALPAIDSALVADVTTIVNAQMADAAFAGWVNIGIATNFGSTTSVIGWYGIATDGVPNSAGKLVML